MTIFVCISKELVDSLRKSSKGSFRILIEPSINCDYVLSDRTAVMKTLKSEIVRLYQRDVLIEKVKNAKNYFEKVMVLAVDDYDESPYFAEFNNIVSLIATVVICKSEFNSFTKYFCSKFSWLFFN
jgi:hypothetical protein